MNEFIGDHVGLNFALIMGRFALGMHRAFIWVPNSAIVGLSGDEERLASALEHKATSSRHGLSDHIPSELYGKKGAQWSPSAFQPPLDDALMQMALFGPALSDTPKRASL